MALAFGATTAEPRRKRQEMKNKTTYNSTTPELIPLLLPETQPNVQTTSVPNRTQLVPGFEQKIGLAYIGTCGCFTFNLGVGYQAQVYINGVQTVDMTAPQVLPALALFTPDTGVFAVGFERTLSNYILTGPYVSLSVTF